MRNLESDSYDILDYYPNGGERYEENGRIVYWNTSQANTVEESLNLESDGKKPLDAKEIDTPDGKAIIVKWEAELSEQSRIKNIYQTI